MYRPRRPAGSWQTKTFNIDNGNGTVDHDFLYSENGLTILTAVIFFTEATDASGAADSHVKIGTTDAGTEVVASTALSAGKAVGGTQTVTLVERAVAAGGFLDVCHTGIATTEAGQYKVCITYQNN